MSVVPTPPPSLRERLLHSFSSAPKTIGLVWNCWPTGLLGSFVLVICASALPIGMAWVGKLIIDAVIAAQSAAPELRATAMRTVCVLVLIELALTAGMVAVERGGSLLRQLLGWRLSTDLTLRIMQKALSFELKHFENSLFYDKLARARRDVAIRPLSLVQQNFQALRGILVIIGYSMLLFRFSPWAVFGLLCAAIPVLLAETRFAGASFRLRNAQAPESRRLKYLEFLVSSDTHAKEIKLFGIGPSLVFRFREIATRLFAQDKSLAIRRSSWVYALSLIATLAYYSCYMAIAFSAASGRTSVGDMTLYVIAFRQSQIALENTLSALGGMYEDSLYMAHLFDFLASPIVSCESPSVHQPVCPGERGIRFENVGFRYADAKNWALRGVSLYIPPGQSVALVGRNGAGKTTLIKLLAALYTPTEGRILIDGQDMRAWREADVRRRISVLFQDFNRYQFTARENVALGSIDHLHDDDRIARAIGRSDTGELLEQLPAGLHTQLGRWFENGTELSGGQWQKIALARMLMREEADILVFDEPTAALDPKAESSVFQKLRSISEGRTLLIISHRLTTARMAKRIFVFDQGRMVEEGCHEELIRRDGKYTELFRFCATADG